MKAHNYLGAWYEDLTNPRDIVDRKRCNFIYTSLTADGIVSFAHICLGRPLRISNLKPKLLRSAIRAYQRIWYYADAYRELWGPEEARAAIEALEDCFIAVDELEQVVALAGGKPLSVLDNPNIIEKVKDASRTYYFAELGRVEEVRNNRIGSFLFELTMINAIKKGYSDFVLITAENGSVVEKLGQNPAKKMYESHGYQLATQEDGTFIGKQCEQRRCNDQVITDWRPYYYSSSVNFLETMGLPTQYESI